jgi:hypothetical protein
MISNWSIFLLVFSSATLGAGIIVIAGLVAPMVCR